MIDTRLWQPRFITAAIGLLLGLSSCGSLRPDANPGAMKPPGSTFLQPSHPAPTPTVVPPPSHAAAPGPHQDDIGDLARTGPHRLDLDVDATDLPRGLLHARERLHVVPGPLALWFPLWIPGTHAPCGLIANLAGPVIHARGTPDPVPWRRDPFHLCRFTCTVPPDCTSVTIDLTYICNQPPDPNALDTDSYGEPTLGIVNWNSCVLYPETVPCDQLQVRAHIRLPAGWSEACALDPVPQGNGVWALPPTDLMSLVDAPLVCGRHLHTDGITVPGFPPLFLDDVEESAKPPLGAGTLAGLANLLGELQALYGRAPFAAYHLLLVHSSRLPAIGMEHGASSLNVFNDALMDHHGDLDAASSMQLVHEFDHAWCGKYRRPAPMATHDFHTPQDTSLIWVYEGLDQYLGYILSVRSGLITLPTLVSEIEEDVRDLRNATGRSWRSIDDTAVANAILRGRRNHWSHLRRDQDYYSEGVLFWLEVDCRIRILSHGKRSLDDFCRRFLGVHGPLHIRTYVRDDVIRSLQAVAPFDW